MADSTTARRTPQGSWKDACVHLRAITPEPIDLFKRSKSISCRELPPCFPLRSDYSYKICLCYQPPTACYSHNCKSSMSCCGEAELQGRGCSWISPAIATVLLTVWGFQAKIKQSSTASEKLFSAFKGFTKV